MLRILPDIAEAIAQARPVVALETSVLAQGLPIPANADALERMQRAVRDAGAAPALTAVVRGTPALGLLPDETARFLARDGVRKVAARDLSVCIADGADGATTVSASLALARMAGLSVFATGGIGGVHRSPAFDESADLGELGRTPMVVVCAGAKSILDLPATLERLESLGVTVVGYGTDELPGFFTASTGLRVPARADTPAAIAAIHRAARTIGLPGATLVVQPPPAESALDAAEVDAAVAAAVEMAEREGVSGGALTPWLLEHVQRATGGRTLGANLALLEANAALAGRVAMELSTSRRY